MRLDEPAIHTAIEDVGNQIADRFHGRYLAILLVGSAARGEITVDASDRVLSDLDFLVVLPQTSMALAFLEMRRCHSRLQAVQSRIAQRPFRHVTVGMAHAVPGYWAAATPFMWELRQTAHVLHGSAAVKGWPVIQTAGDIPRWEGIRLIANRMCELIEMLGVSEVDRRIPEEFLPYACLKTVLACSEAALIDRGFYVATYRERSQRHTNVAEYFTNHQNSLIEMGYQLKLGWDVPIRPPSELAVRETLQLALSTLARLGITAPSHFTGRAKQEPHTAPGYEQDALYWATQALRLRRVPLRRPITAVYADAYRAAVRIVQSSSGHTAPTPLCRRVASRYTLCPQTVSMVPRSTPLRYRAARPPC